MVHFMKGSLRIKLLMFLFVVIFSESFTFGVIQGSAHDFSAQSWSNGEICLPCHTPHNADNTVLSAPLWNHQVTSATFTIYSSPSMVTTPEQPREPSKLCLSCHDGTIALDSFGGSSGSNFMTGSANLDIDLSDDHPISIYWSHQNDILTSAGCIRCHNPNPTDFNPILPFFDRYIECPTCHDPHNTSNNPRLLRKPLANSEICFHCHDK